MAVHYGKLTELFCENDFVDSASYQPVEKDIGLCLLGPADGARKLANLCVRSFSHSDIKDLHLQIKDKK
eukprot:4446880-Karenia_brevis.AAC.1